MYSLSDFDFNLPQENIAQTPLAERSASRLLHLDGETVVDRQFADIVGQLAAGDLLVMNDTRVLKARFFGVKESGGKIEALVERVLDERTVLAQVRASKSPPPGCRIRLADAFDVTVGQRASIEALIARDHPGFGEALGGDAPILRADCSAQRGIVRKARQRGAKIRLVYRNERAVRLAHHRRHVADRRTDDGQARRHRLDHRNRCLFAPRREREQVEMTDPARRFGHEPR